MRACVRAYVHSHRGVLSLCVCLCVCAFVCPCAVRAHVCLHVYVSHLSWVAHVFAGAYDES